MYGWSCIDCDNLDKTRKQWNDAHYCYRYGCRARKDNGYICFWCKDDNDLKTGGCSDFKHEEQEQLSLF